MSVLTDLTYLYKLAPGALIQGRVQAFNIQGGSLQSVANTVGVTAQVIPFMQFYIDAAVITPYEALSRVEELCTVSSIAIEMPLVADYSMNAGNSQVTSYGLEYD